MNANKDIKIDFFYDLFHMLITIVFKYYPIDFTIILIYNCLLICYFFY
jgi:hypothetical protein